MSTTVKIRPGSLQPDAVQIDHPETGEPIDIGPAVAGVTLRMKPGDLPEITLDLLVLVKPVELKDPIVTVPEPTRRLLGLLGWRPPASSRWAGPRPVAPAGWRLDVAALADAVERAVQIDGTTYRDAARRIGVSASTLTRIKQGQRPDVDGLIAILAWLNLDLADVATTGTEAVQARAGAEER